MNDRDYTEKRDFIRMTINANVTLQVMGQAFPAVCRDLSSNGMQLQAATHLKVGDMVKVHLPSNHPSLDDYEVDAEVVRIEAVGDQQIVGLTVLNKH